MAEAPPQTPPIAKESAFELASLTRWREGRQFPSLPQAPETLGTPLGPGSYEAESTKCLIGVYIIYYIHCVAHALNLVINDAVKTFDNRHWIVGGGGRLNTILPPGARDEVTPLVPVSIAGLARVTGPSLELVRLAVALRGGLTVRLVLAFCCCSATFDRLWRAPWCLAPRPACLTIVSRNSSPLLH